jgi:Phosphate-selective porin O and P
VTKTRFGYALLASLFVAGSPRSARAYDVDPNLSVDGYFQEWFTVYEQMEDLRGLYQHPSNDEAADGTSGFRLANARVGLRARTADRRFGVVALVRLEKDAGILDLYGTATVAPWLTLLAGQFPVPSTYENLQPNPELDFLLRTQIAGALSDYALSRTTHASSLFYGNRSYRRDMGAGVRMHWEPGGLPIRTFGMVGNGFGANLHVGGDTNREYVIANKPFDWFYAGRLEVEPWPEVVTLGGHASYNRHNDIVFNSGRAVLDIRRTSYSTDLRFDYAPSGMRGAVAYGAGKNLDDWDDNGAVDFAYEGWEWRLIGRLNPLLKALTTWPALDHHAFELAFRYDALTTESDESGVRIRHRTWTPGFNYLYKDILKVQANWIVRRTDDPFNPDLADNAFILSLQGRI